ncbi:gag-pol polyprotein [Cucumis melo var. makuwa]|nr:gag-pol polyprotein [Cucumis melo var. makuwa]
MEIIMEGLSTSRSSVLGDKNYSYWKPHKMSFLKTLDGKTDAKEQASVGNSRVLNAVFNVFGDETIGYNERVLEIANESFNLGEKIPESKIVRKVLRSILENFDIKVTTIEEAHDKPKLKLDELFGSLLTFEMVISNREDKKGKGIAFKSTYEEESTDNKSSSEVNVNESIALLTKQFSKVVKRMDGENFKRRDGEGRTFKCWECGGFGHYQAECPTFLRKQKKNFRATLSDEETDDSEEDDGFTNAFIINITKTDSIAKYEDSEEESENSLSYKQLKINWKEDSIARAVHMARNLSFFSTLKECSSGHVTFGDDAKGNFEKHNLSCLNDVRYVEGLKENLISIRKLCDQGYIVNFSKDDCVVTGADKRVLMIGSRQTDKCYHWVSNNNDLCHLTKKDYTRLWHKKLGHANLSVISKAIKNEVVVGIPNIDSHSKLFFDDCQLGKQIKSSHRSIKECNANSVLELLHMDLMGPMQTESLGDKKYVFIVVDDFSQFTWIRFLRGKSDTAKVCISLCLSLQHERGKNIVRIMSDHEKEFENEKLNNFCEVEDREYHRKWDAKSDTWIFLGYSHNSLAYKVFNNRTRIVMETTSMVVNDNEKPLYKRTDDEDNLSIQPSVAPKLVVADVPSVDTTVTNCGNSFKSTWKEVMSNVSELAPSSHI